MLVISTILPRYITAIRSHMYRATARSWVMYRYETLYCSARFNIRSMMEIRIETSSIEVGSSATTNVGSITRAASNGDALALTSGQLMRVSRKMNDAAGVKPHEIKQPGHPILPFA